MPIYPQNCIKCSDCCESNEVCLNKISVCGPNFQNDYFYTNCCNYCDCLSDKECQK
jgi:hypothetical protein